MQGKESKAIEERLLEEFMDRTTPRVSFHVKAQVPATAADALRLAKRYESLITEMTSAMLIHGESPDVLAAQVAAARAPFGPDPADTRSAPTQPATPVFHASIVCWGCGAEGHYRRDCMLSCGNWQGYDQYQQYPPMMHFQSQPNYYQMTPHYPQMQPQPVQMVHQVPMTQMYVHAQQQQQMMVMPAMQQQQISGATAHSFAPLYFCPENLLQLQCARESVRSEDEANGDRRVQIELCQGGGADGTPGRASG
ncbi:hypothetical protein PFISCL1PPCAC_25009 [Pristionchus fissidentatus]|uniref:CCHC-type domain-containing protein n=1 Tax=Pristionchus fissidentatus TaxID=1538716 RepID=A0AAV5WNX0_9BILA|nr:hypothetical protein PFISCL1PPCAC_25009 [Pristionchus fissidentatus]